MMVLAQFRKTPLLVAGLLILCLCAAPVFGAGLAEIRQRGALRHLGIPYANFVIRTDAGVEGLDVELMRRFAAHLGVRYEWVNTTWSDAFCDLTGNKTTVDADGRVTVTGETEVRGDILANGLTALPWREKLVRYSTPTFPTGVWLVARADSPLKPIAPSGDMETDIQQVMAMVKGRSILAMKGTCLDPDLYELTDKGAEIKLYAASQNLSEMAPAVIDGAADATLLDIPDALIALQKWPGEIKVIGPVSPLQHMGVAVAPSSGELLDAFNAFFDACRKDGSYKELVRKYYPSVFVYLGAFFDKERNQ